MTSRFPCLALLALALAACKPQPQAAVPEVDAPPPAATRPASTGTVEHTAEMPRLQVQTVDGKRYDLADHRGQWVLVNFWATWCGPCLHEMPELSALHAMRGNIDVVGLAYEDIEPAEMQAFLEKHPVAYPIVILDPYDPPQDFATPRGLPVTYLIAPDGKVARQFLGPVDAAQVEQAIIAAGGKVE
ncbi:MAG: TlpA disulfide reductase family protein [Stenotrophomonas sp.]